MKRIKQEFIAIFESSQQRFSIFMEKALLVEPGLKDYEDLKLPSEETDKKKADKRRTKPGYMKQLQLLFISGLKRVGYVVVLQLESILLWFAKRRRPATGFYENTYR